MNPKWTGEMRRQLSARLLAEFGPFRCWTGKQYPLGKTEQFSEVIADLAARFSALANQTNLPSAVKMQLAWAVTTQAEMKDRSHVRNFVQNKAAAIEVGFITSAELPEKITSQAATAKRNCPQTMEEFEAELEKLIASHSVASG